MQLVSVAMDSFCVFRSLLPFRLFSQGNIFNTVGHQTSLA